MLSAVHVAGNSRGLLIEANLLGRGREGDLVAPAGVNGRGNQLPAQ
jgi:hypothetical protein